MSDEPKPTTGEWTAETVMKMFGWRYKKRAEVVANAHNTALAAEREKTVLNLNDIRDKTVNMIACGINHTLSSDDEEYVKGQVDWALRQCVLKASKEIQQLREQLAAEREAAEKLCKIYFEIAAKVIGEDEVRRRRDDLLGLLGDKKFR